MIMKKQIEALFEGKNAKIYTYILLASIILVGACLFWITGDRSISTSVLDSPYLFSDYFIHINNSALKSDIYLHPELPICLPPLAYIFYTLLWRLEPAAYFTDGNEMRNNGNALVVFVMVNIFTAILLVLLIDCYFKNRNISNVMVCLLAFLILCSYPCMNTSIQRGNSVLLVAIIVGFAFYLIDQDSKVCRETALILIAIAAGLKTYPALCGLYLLCQKRYKEAIRLIIYGLIFCIFPFAFFGGIEGFKGFLSNVSNYASGSFSRWCTLRGYFGMMLKAIGFDSLNESKLNMVAIILEIVFTFIMIFMMVITKEKWKRTLYLMSIVILIPSGNWMYTLCYLLVPFLMYLSGRNTNTENGLSKVACVLFTVIFSQPFFFETRLGNVMNWKSVGWIYTILFVLLIVCLMYDIKTWNRFKGEI